MRDAELTPRQYPVSSHADISDPPLIRCCSIGGPFRWSKHHGTLTKVMVDGCD
jgi:hypothetical protein